MVKDLQQSQVIVDARAVRIYKVLKLSWTKLRFLTDNCESIIFLPSIWKKHCFGWILISVVSPYLAVHAVVRVSIGETERKIKVWLLYVRTD